MSLGGEEAISNGNSWQRFMKAKGLAIRTCRAKTWDCGPLMPPQEAGLLSEGPVRLSPAGSTAQQILSGNSLQSTDWLALVLKPGSHDRELSEQQ